jgi:hypothetical protein
MFVGAAWRDDIIYSKPSLSISCKPYRKHLAKGGTQGTIDVLIWLNETFGTWGFLKQHCIAVHYQNLIKVFRLKKSAKNLRVCHSDRDCKFVSLPGGEADEKK